MDMKQQKKQSKHGTEGFLMAEWISVKNRLPDNNKPVLVFAHSVPFTAAYVTRRRKWVVIGQYRCSDLREGKTVTHWMPLPEPPKENEYEMVSD